MEGIALTEKEAVKGLEQNVLEPSVHFSDLMSWQVDYLEFNVVVKLNHNLYLLLHKASLLPPWPTLKLLLFYAVLFPLL